MEAASAISGLDAEGRRSSATPVRLMVVDDSITARAVFTRIIKRESDLEMVAQASTAEDALLALKTVEVDVILLDLEMPGMGGLDALPLMIERSNGARILVVSTLTVAGAQHTVAALSLGAADTSPKPQPGKFDEAYCDNLLEKIRMLARGRLRKGSQPVTPQKTPPVSRKPTDVLAIGASTGGIHALGQFFESLPPILGIPILITQHLPASFMTAFADQIERVAKRKTTLAKDRMILRADEILIAPGDAHLTVCERQGHYEVVLTRQPVASGCMPSVDPMLESLAEVYSGRALGVILSGMGRDGTVGAKRLVEAGGTIFAQNEATCAVWGMPGSVTNAGLASSVLPPEQLAGRVATNQRKI